MSTYFAGEYDVAVIGGSIGGSTIGMPHRGLYHQYGRGG